MNLNKALLISIILMSSSAFCMTPPMTFEKNNQIKEPCPPFSFGGMDIDKDEVFNLDDFIDSDEKIDESSAEKLAHLFRNDSNIFSADTLYSLIKKKSK